MIERTISTSGSTGTGLKKCSPSTRSGCDVSAPSFMIGTDDVFEARNCASGSSASRRLNSSRLAPSSSMIASIAASAPSTSSSAVVNASRSSAASRSSVGRACPPRTPRSSDFSIACARLLAARPSSTSTTVTSTPERAHTSAIPEPMSPPPITPTRMAGHATRDRSRAAVRRLGQAGGATRLRSTGTTQTQLGSFVEPGRTMRPAPRSAAACRATSAASFRSSTCCATASRCRARRCRSRRTWCSVSILAVGRTAWSVHDTFTRATVPVRRPSSSRRCRPSRKVRTSQGRVVGNADPGKPAGKCHRKHTAHVRGRHVPPRAGKVEMVR